MEYDFKSSEEQQFAQWLDAAKMHKLVDSWEYEPESFELIPAKSFIEQVSTKTKTKSVERSLHAAASYTPDFKIILSDVGIGVFEGIFKKALSTAKDPHVLWTDVKGGFSRTDDGRHFSLLQKLFFHVHGIYVEKVIPKKLFQKTFAPELVRWMKSRKTPTMTKIGTLTKTIEQFLEEIT